MPTRSDREEFERRLLALVRDYMDEADERYLDGYEIGDFMVLYEVFPRISESESLPPWSGGVRAGFHAPIVSISSTTRRGWLDEALLAEALSLVGDARTKPPPDTEGEEDEDETENGD